MHGPGAKRSGKTRICQACQRAFVSTHGRWYCSDVCRGEIKILTCMTCKQSFRSRHSGRWYCSEECRTTSKAPAVYRFICPDGRSYVGSVRDCRKRANNGIQRSNLQLLAAFELHPPKTWTFEVLEQLPSGCSSQALREAEQHHIDRLRSCSPEFGFNMTPATWTADGPAQRVGRQQTAARFAIARQKKEPQLKIKAAERDAKTQGR
jgi:hypothetical protein